jgi:hypothetical protein
MVDKARELLKLGGGGGDGIENRGRSELEYGKKEPFCLLFFFFK